MLSFIIIIIIIIIITIIIIIIVIILLLLLLLLLLLRSWWWLLVKRLLLLFEISKWLDILVFLDMRLVFCGHVYFAVAGPHQLSSCHITSISAFMIV